MKTKYDVGLEVSAVNQYICDYFCIVSFPFYQNKMSWRIKDYGDIHTEIGINKDQSDQ